MKVLILSCNTGEGHNAAGKAVLERVLYEGHQAVMLDYYLLAGKTTSKLVGQAYVKTAKNFPRFFGFIYKLGGLISNKRFKSPVYYTNTLMAKHLKAYLDENDYDVIVTPHLFPAETLTYMKRKEMLSIKTVAIATDYTCIPFWEETECDYYVIAHEDLLPEYLEKGMDASNIYSFGIPVKMAFCQPQNKTQIRSRLHLPLDKPLYLVMSGSMGFGKIQLFAYELIRNCQNGEHIIIICGNNKKLRKTLRREFRNQKNIHIIGYTNHVSDFMDACDVIYTKPGGLTSSEALAKNIPIVHTAAIPGCELKNRDFFVSRGMSVAAEHIHTQVAQGKMLVENSAVRGGMLEAQRTYAHKDAGLELFHLLEKITNEKPEKNPL